MSPAALRALSPKDASPLKKGSAESLAVLELLEKRVPRRSPSSERMAREQTWLRDSLYYAGVHKFSMIGNQVVQVPLKAHEVRYRANFVKLHVNRAMATVLNMEGQFAAVPQSSAVAALESARMTMNVWDHQRSIVDFPKKRANVVQWAAVTGTAFFLNLWDPSKGDLDRFYWLDEKDRSVVPPDLLSPEERQFRDQMRWFDDLHPGEITCEAMPPFQAYPDEASKDDIEHCRYFCQHQYLPRAVIAELFGVDEKEIDAEDASTSSMRYEETLANLTAGGTALFGSQNRGIESKDRAWLTQCWERPCSEYPRGRYMAAAGGLVLRDMENPYCADRTGKLHIPVVKYVWNRSPGSFWGLSMVSDLTSAQFQRNESRAKELAYLNLFAQPGLLVPQNCGITPSKVTNALGPVYEYNPAMGEPKPFPVPIMPAEVSRNAAVCEGEMAQLASQSSIDTAKMPGQIKSGVGLSTLMRDRDLALTMPMREALRAERDCGEQFIALAKVYYSGERVALYRGPSGELAAQAFLATDLSNNIRIMAEPGQMETSQGFRDQIAELVQAGVLNPAVNEEDRQIVLRALRYNSAQEAIDDRVQHEQRQNAEILEMLANPNIGSYPVLPYEDDKAHMRVLVRFFHSDEFRRLDEQRKTLLMSHWSMHQASDQLKEQSRLAMIAATQSTPSAPGVASQPRGRSTP